MFKPYVTSDGGKTPLVQEQGHMVVGGKVEPRPVSASTNEDIWQQAYKCLSVKKMSWNVMTAFLLMLIMDQETDE